MNPPAHGEAVKSQVRFLGVDDSPFGFEDERVRIVGVVTRSASYIEGVLTSWADTDGLDATDRLVEMVGSTRFRPMLRCLFLNGVTVGGFNVMDLDEVHRRLKLPVVSVVRDEPDLDAARNALEKHFSDWKQRWALLQRLRPSPVANGRFRVWCTARGLRAEELPPLLSMATIRGAIPEPVRLAHVIASGVARGESRGPA